MNVDTDADQAERDWSRATLVELCDHIEQTHHRYVREHWPRIEALLETEHAQRAERDPDLAKLQKLAAALKPELFGHLEREEKDLFPVIRQLERGDPHTINLRLVPAAVALMVDEHAETDAAFQAMHALTNDFTPPESASAAYVELLKELDALERDLERHIHKEDELLFPRVPTLLAKAGTGA